MRRIVEVVLWLLAAGLLVATCGQLVAEPTVTSGRSTLVCPNAALKAVWGGAHVRADAGGEPGAAAADFTAADQARCEESARDQVQTAVLSGAAAAVVVAFATVLAIRRRRDPDDRRRRAIARTNAHAST